MRRIQSPLHGVKRKYIERKKLICRVNPEGFILDEGATRPFILDIIEHSGVFTEFLCGFSSTAVACVICVLCGDDMAKMLSRN